MSRRKYSGKPFSPLAFAYMESDGDGGELASFFDAPIGEVVDGTPRWIAKYKLVSVRKLKLRTIQRVVEVK